MKRTVFFISDGTGITAEALGHSLLTQFDNIEFNYVTLAYTNTLERAQAAASKINQAAKQDQQRCLVFDTVLDKSIRQIIDGSQCFMIDIFATFLAPLEQELATQSSYTVGKHRTIQDYQSYNQRIKAVNFSLASDDGLRTQDYEQADLILIGVSRSGKTPTCLYLALQFGLQAANYPLTEEDLSLHRLPHSLLTHKAKLFGLTIDPQRLRSIRSERRANSRYAALAQCQKEVKAAEGLLKQERIPYINTTQLSVEEIASQILAITGARN